MIDSQEAKRISEIKERLSAADEVISKLQLEKQRELGYIESLKERLQRRGMDSFEAAEKFVESAMKEVLDSIPKLEELLDEYNSLLDGDNNELKI